ncbi:MAG: hypothetical protein KDD11_00455 [Acidobacteria bacterium]|nr:hypothetical protein [Acidobacteriota bacterium]
MSGRDPGDEAPEAGEPGDPAPDTLESDKEPEHLQAELGGPLRQIYLVCFEDPNSRRALSWLARAIESSVRPFGSPDAGPRRRVRAIAAELDALGTFLLFSVDTRQRTELTIPDWELARLAHEAGTALVTWADALRAAIGDPAAPPRELDADPDLGVRETALWPAEETDFATEVREVCRMLFGFNCEVGYLKTPSPSETEPAAESPTRRDLRAAAQDLLHLAAFTTTVSRDLPTGDPLHGLLGTLTFRLARLVETLCAGFELPS